MNRVTTLVIKTDEKLPQWIMDAHTNPEGVNGVKVIKIGTGDAMKKLDKIEESLEDNHHGKIESLMDKIGEILDSDMPDLSVLKGPKNE